MIAPVEGKVGQTITLEGYADDYGNHIVALEFSLDGGATWVRHSTEESDPDRLVHWTYAYTPQAAGVYRFCVRSVTEDGRVSPMAASAELYISE